MVAIPFPSHTTVCWFCGGEMVPGKLCETCRDALAAGGVGLIEPASGSRLLLTAQGAAKFLKNYPKLRGEIVFVEPEVIVAFQLERTGGN